MSRNKKKKKHPARAPVRAPAPPPPPPAPDVPPWLHYRVSQATAQADQTIRGITQQTMQALQSNRMLQGRVVLEEHTLPLVAAVMQLAIQQQADLVGWAQNAMMQLLQQQEEADEPVFGIPAEEADELCAELEEVMEWLAATGDTFARNETPELSADDFHRRAKALAEVAEAIDDYALEEAEDEDEGDEDEDEEDEEGEDEDAPLVADEPPLDINDPDAAPLMR